MNFDLISSFLSFPDGLNWLIYFVIIVTSFISSFISSIIGFGGGLLMLGVLALFFHGSAIIPLHAIIQLGSNFSRLVFFKFNVQWSIVIPFSLGCVIGVPIGGLLYLSINEDLIKLLIALFIIFNILNKVPVLNSNKLLFTGVISSFLSTIIGVTGSLISSIVQSYDLDQSKYISSCAFLLFTQHLFKCILFGVLGFAFKPYFLLLLLVIIGGIIGTLLGKLIVFKVPEYYFKLFIKILLLIISLNLIVNSINNILM